MAASDVNGGSECSTESFTGSWVKLDESRLGQSLTNSPKFSDDEEMAEVLADAQEEQNGESNLEKDTKMTPSRKRKREEDVTEWMKKQEEPAEEVVVSKGYLTGNAYFLIPTLLLSHLLVLGIGIMVGKKLASRSASSL